MLAISLVSDFFSFSLNCYKIDHMTFVQCSPLPPPLPGCGIMVIWFKLWFKTCPISCIITGLDISFRGLSPHQDTRNICFMCECFMCECYLQVTMMLCLSFLSQMQTWKILAVQYCSASTRTMIERQWSKNCRICGLFLKIPTLFYPFCLSGQALISSSGLWTSVQDQRWSCLLWTSLTWFRLCSTTNFT